MKRIIYIVLLTICVSLAIFSCTEDNVVPKTEENGVADKGN